MAKRVRKRKKPPFQWRSCLPVLAALIVAVIFGWNWLQDHPEHNPLAPLDLNDRVGWATAGKLVALRDNVEECHASLDRSGVSYQKLPEMGPQNAPGQEEGACLLDDRTLLDNYPLVPNVPATTCPVAAGLHLWREQSLNPAARELLGSQIVYIEHLGVFNCRKIRGSNNNWSQHATANAIDISAFVLADGRRISLIDDWDGDADRAAFLRRVRNDACGIFSTVLSPDFNDAHADHFHLDQGRNWVGICR